MDLKELQDSFTFVYQIENPQKIDGWLAPGDAVSELARKNEEIVNSRLFGAFRN